MNKVIILLIIFIFCSLMELSCEKGQAERDFVPVTVFDPARDAAKDIDLAIRKAQQTDKHILLNVGGDWCTWCRKFDKIFVDNSDIRDYLHQNFVLVKINYSPDNRNKDILSKFPTITGYPYLFVLDESGELLHSQDTVEFEDGKTYNRNKVLNFLQKCVENGD